jgi:hypothetical protein
MAVDGQVFLDNGDGTVADTKQNLIWQKGDAGPMRWEDAVAHCENLTLAGKSDWRLPTRKEFKALFRALSDDDHVIDRRFPPFEWNGDRYWSGTVVDPYYAAFLFDFRCGGEPWEAKNRQFYVRAVRSV